MSNLKTEFTFKELTRIALGAPTIGPDQFAALHILFLSILRKKQYENEIVSIKGVAAVCLRKLLNKCKEAPFNFQYAEKTFNEKEELLKTLEIRMICLRRKYEAHLEKVRKCKKYFMYPDPYWISYHLQTEDIKETESDVGKLLDNRLFISVLREKSTVVVLEKLNELENRIENLRKKLEGFRKNLDTRGILESVAAILPMNREIKRLNEIAERNGKLLTETVPEIQDMLNCKVDRLVLPSLTTWLKLEFPKIERVVMDLTHIPVECVPASIWDTNKNCCISCGSNFRLFEAKRDALLLGNWNEKCSCHAVTKYTNLLEKITKFRIRTYRLSNQQKPSLRMSPANLKRKFSRVSLSRYSLPWDATRGLTAFETRNLSSSLDNTLFKPLLSVRLDSRADVRASRMQSVISLNNIWE